MILLINIIPSVNKYLVPKGNISPYQFDEDTIVYPNYETLTINKVINDEQVMTFNDVATNDTLDEELLLEYYTIL